MKKIDAASPLLLLHCARGTHIKEANFVVRKAGGTQLEYLKIKLTEVLVSHFAPHGKAERWITPVHQGTQSTGKPLAYGGDEIPLEDLSLSFATIECSYQLQGADGKAQGGPIMAGWDIKANKKI